MPVVCPDGWMRITALATAVDGRFGNRALSRSWLERGQPASVLLRGGSQDGRTGILAVEEDRMQIRFENFSPREFASGVAGLRGDSSGFAVFGGRGRLPQRQGPNEKRMMASMI